MVLESESLSSNFRQVMNKTNHCVRALRVEFVIVSSFNLGPLVNSLFFRLFVWIFCNTVFDVITEVGDKAHSIFQFDVEGLVINGRPFTVNNFFVALSFATTFANYCLCFISLDEVDSVNVFASELELMTLVHHLNLVWHRVSA